MKLIIATHNPDKIKEFERILSPLSVTVTTAKLDEVEETGSTFEENAFLKADAACRATGLPAVADDSGLAVDILNGEPGVYSARYAGEGASSEDCNRKLLHALRDLPAEKRSARFVCAICCVFPNGDIITARGECEGSIAFSPRGSGGFGYDPLFLVGGRSFGELSGDEKDKISHRGRALREFAEKLKKYEEQ
ncbi:dITP/XTP pyrophosphatase [Caprobacter fermentans]|uniref:dITP/XTP pyrophosphatase n=1 Tax=Caproicibacter fermentans TaxID=2576756 RepID=A0A6N8I1Z3_9FIRM|nr:RdgB/HAM1 family non-canonical purine NTP pyrophosphatase [Caproicibacter fermentans]MVB11895.1 dITP/XTP pyrophosphatase [Caproicibacter fermentans]OCM99867.1 non-canonical purine NTP pyrophosphatase, RdgB/HAM1 family [Clostridium sp. W14A]QNK41131.1 RdgB/HAM1 family non-canonical purine NTP pyrophosphatase [Caproicibacter fermentans]